MLYLIFTSLIWAFSYGLIKTKLSGLDANFLTATRMLIASLVFLPFLRVNQLRIRECTQLAFIGAVQYGLMYLCFLRSFEYLAAYQAALFTTMTPIYVILVNDLYNRKFNARYFRIALLAMLGGALIYYKNIDQDNILRGFIWVQGADICFALGQVAYKRFRALHTSIQDHKIYAMLFIGALFIAAIATSISGSWNNVQLLSGQQLLVLLYLGAIASGLCFFLWNKGAVLTNTATLAVFNNLKSPLAILVSIVFFQESADLLRLGIGLGIIGLALYLSEKKPKRQSDPSYRHAV